MPNTEASPRITRITKQKAVTYLGRRAKVWDVQKTSNRLGERVGLILWIDDACEKNGGHSAGTVLAHHCSGDGRYADFESFEKRTFSSVAEAETWAVETLAAR